MLENFFFHFLQKKGKKGKIRIEKYSKLLNQQLEKQTQTKRNKNYLNLLLLVSSSFKNQNLQGKREVWKY
jgi:hypothetical protein